VLSSVADTKVCTIVHSYQLKINDKWYKTIKTINFICEVEYMLNNCYKFYAKTSCYF